MTDDVATAVDANEVGGAAPEPDENEPATLPLDDESKEPASDGGASGALWDLVSRHPYRALFDRWADISEWNARSGICFAMEFLVTTVVVAIVVTIAVLLAWKAIMPLPKA